MICDKSPSGLVRSTAAQTKSVIYLKLPRINPQFPSHQLASSISAHHVHVRADPHGSPCLSSTSGRRLRRARERGAAAAAGRCQARACAYLAHRRRRCCGRRFVGWFCCCCAAAGVHRRAVHAPAQPQVGRGGGRRPRQEAGEVAQGDARVAHGARRARRLRHLPGRAQPSRRLLAAGRRAGQRRRHTGAPVQVPQAVHGVLLLQLDGVRDVGGDHRPAHERVLLPLGGQGGGAGGHRGARHGGAHGRLHRRLHARGLLLHLHHRPHRRRLPLRPLHRAVPAQALGPPRPRSIPPQGGAGRRAARAPRHPPHGGQAKKGGHRPDQVGAAGVGRIGHPSRGRVMMAFVNNSVSWTL